MALPHSILINLYIKVGLKISSPTSPVKYCFCPTVFSRLQEGCLTRGDQKGVHFCPINREPGYEFVEHLED